MSGGSAALIIDGDYYFAEARSVVDLALVNHSTFLKSLESKLHVTFANKYFYCAFNREAEQYKEYQNILGDSMSGPDYRVSNCLFEQTNDVESHRPSSTLSLNQNGIDVAIGTKAIECAFGLNGETVADLIVLVTANESIRHAMQCIEHNKPRTIHLITNLLSTNYHSPNLKDIFRECVISDDVIIKQEFSEGHDCSSTLDSTQQNLTTNQVKLETDSDIAHNFERPTSPAPSSSLTDVSVSAAEELRLAYVDELTKLRAAQFSSAPANNFNLQVWNNFKTLRGTSVLVSGADGLDINGLYRYAGLMNRAGYFEKQTTGGRLTVYRFSRKDYREYTWFLSLVPEREKLPGGARDVNYFYSLPGSEGVPRGKWYSMAPTPQHTNEVLRITHLSEEQTSAEVATAGDREWKQSESSFDRRDSGERSRRRSRSRSRSRSRDRRRRNDSRDSSVVREDFDDRPALKKYRSDDLQRDQNKQKPAQTRALPQSKQGRTIHYLRDARSETAQTSDTLTLNVFTDAPQNLPDLKTDVLVVRGAMVAAANREYRFVAMMNDKAYFESSAASGEKGRYMIYCCKMFRADNLRWFLSYVTDALPGSSRDVNLYFSAAYTDSPVIPDKRWECMTDDFDVDRHMRVTVLRATQAVSISNKSLKARNGSERRSRSGSRPVEGAIDVTDSGGDGASSDENLTLAAPVVEMAVSDQQKVASDTCDILMEIFSLAASLRNGLLAQVSEQLSTISNDLEIDMPTTLEASRLVIDSLRDLQRQQGHELGSQTQQEQRLPPCVVQEEDSYDVSCRNILCSIFHAVSEESVRGLVASTLSVIEPLHSGLSQGLCEFLLFCFCELLHQCHELSLTPQNTNPPVAANANPPAVSAVDETFALNFVKLFKYLFPALDTGELPSLEWVTDTVQSVSKTCDITTQIAERVCTALYDSLQEMSALDLKAEKSVQFRPHTKTNDRYSDPIRRCELILMNVFPYLSRTAIERSLADLLQATTSEWGVSEAQKALPVVLFCDKLNECEGKALARKRNSNIKQ